MLIWLKWVSGLLGVSSWFGALTVVAGVVVAVTAAANWIKEDAVESCNVEWKGKLSAANVKLDKTVFDRSARIRELEEALAAKSSELALAEQRKESELENQRDKIPQSEACVACRIPNERLWLRKRASTVGGS